MNISEIYNVIYKVNKKKLKIEKIISKIYNPIELLQILDNYSDN